MRKVLDTPENFRTCMSNNCSACPSFPKAQGEGLYCSRGKSKLPIDKKGCNCPNCPVWKENGLSDMYYCGG